MTNGASFNQYGKHFQEGVVQALLSDQTYAEQMIETFDINYLDQRYLSFLADHYFKYAKKYKVFPTLPLLLTIIKEDIKSGTDAALREQVIDYLQRMRSNPDTNDLPYIKEKSLDFVRKQAIKLAFEKCLEHLQDEKYETIVEEMRKAISVGTMPQLGHDFFEDIEARFVEEPRSVIATGMKELDDKEILNGGMGCGELIVILAGTGIGKSHFMTYLGTNAMRAGKNVLHYTFEMSEKRVGWRYDSNLCDIDSNKIFENKEAVDKKYKESTLGRLKIKFFPTNTASVQTLRSHVERLNLKGFDPDLIIIDYADIMRSSRQYDAPRHELKLIYEELRAFAAEKKIPIVTGSQANKEGSTNEIVDVTNMSEAYGKAHVADFVLGISRRAHEKVTGYGRIYIAKNRNGKDGIVFPVIIDTARSNFAVTGNAQLPEDAKSEDEQDVKKALRQKWQEVKDAMPLDQA